jgi:hypothetical protein
MGGTQSDASGRKSATCSYGGWLIALTVLVVLVAIATLIIVSITLANMSSTTTAAVSNMQSSAKSMASDVGALKLSIAALSASVSKGQGSAPVPGLAQAIQDLQSAASSLRAADLSLSTGPVTAPVASTNPINTLDKTTLSYLSGATIDLNGWSVSTAAGPWLPLGTLAMTSSSVSGGGGSGTTPYGVNLVRIKNSGWWDQSDTYSVPATIKFSGPPTARKACVPALSFTLGADDAFLFTDINSVMGWPAQFKPSSANYVVWPLGGAVYGHLYRDGSLRLMGQDGSPLLPGAYSTVAACVIYCAQPNTQTPPVNFAVSNCSSFTAVSGTVNRQTFVGEYYEYDDMRFQNGILHINAAENCFPMSARANNPGLTADSTMMMAYHRFSDAGVRVGQAAPVVIDPVQVPLSRSTLEYKMLHRASRRHSSNQQEPGLCLTKAGTLITLYFSTMGANISHGGYGVYRSTDGGNTWQKNDRLLYEIAGVSAWPNYNYTIDTGAGTPFVDPLGIDFFRQAVHFAQGAALPADSTDLMLDDGTFLPAGSTVSPAAGVTGMEPIISFGPSDDGAGDARCSVDPSGRIWLTGLERHTKKGHYDDPINYQHAVSWVAYSDDDGKNWSLAAHLDTNRGTDYSYDYPTTDAGPDAAGTGTVLWNVIKVDTTVSELILYGFTAPLEVNTFHVPSAGKTIITRQTLPGSAMGGYGSIAVDQKSGTAYIVGGGVPGVTVDPTDPTAITSVVCGPVGGSCPTLNGLIFFASCSAAPNVVCGTSQVIARTDFASASPNAQATRGTLTEPSIVITKSGDLYVLYADLAPQGPTTIDQNNVLFGGYNRQATLLYLIKSTDKGKTWSAPRIINDTPYVPANSSTDVTAFRQILRYDPVGNKLAVLWTDTRVDMATSTATQRYAAVIPL